MRVFAFLSTMVLAFNSFSQEVNEAFDLTQLNWLHGTWKGVGYERTDLSGRLVNSDAQQREFELTYDLSTKLISFEGQRKFRLDLSQWDEYYHYDRIEKRITLYSLNGEPDEGKAFYEKFVIQFVSDRFLLFSIIYNRRSPAENFIAHGALVRAK